ncbi:MAG: phosphate signaling complex protein PhoU [bacterium]|nr:phosphate signaling complex protein PhoU [bacterium]
MEERFQPDLLKELTLKMLSIAKKNIKEGVDSLANKDAELAERIIAEDRLVDDLELEIEEACIKSLKTLGKEEDVRLISGIWKLITDIERIGDYATHVAEAAKILASKPTLKPLIDIPAMADSVVDMIAKCESALRSYDITYLDSIWETDARIDALYDQVFRELLSYILETPRLITNAIYLAQVARYLERAGDHTTNIAERIFYIITGRRIKRGKFYDRSIREV